MQTLLTVFGGVLGLAAYLGFWFAVFRKAGWPSNGCVLMAIGMVVPGVNVGIAIGFISATWPIQRELSAMAGQARIGTEDDAYEVLSAANRLESKGDAAGAIVQYEEIIRNFAGSEAAKDAEASIRHLKNLIG